MIQDIGSSRLDIGYVHRKPNKSDTLLRFNAEGHILVSSDGDRLMFPDASCIKDNDETAYLFSVDEHPYYLLMTVVEQESDGFSYQDIRKLRGTCRNVDILVVFTAYHLWRWYMDNRLCGRCGHKLFQKKSERALVCEKCSNTLYPRINPAVIVGVIKGDSILITRYRTGYAHNALIAGFTEIGETLEQTVEREVMEETGVKVKNIHYYKSQPWGMAQDVLMGFFCEADGNGIIKMDEEELKYAQWVPRAEVELQPNDLSLTNEMMKMFKDGKVCYHDS